MATRPGKVESQDPSALSKRGEYLVLLVITLVGTFLGVGLSSLATRAYDAAQERRTLRALLVQAGGEANSRDLQLQTKLALLQRDPSTAGQHLDDNPLEPMDSLDYLLESTLFPKYMTQSAVRSLLNERHNQRALVRFSTLKDIPTENRVEHVRLMQQSLAAMTIVMQAEIDYLDGTITASQADAIVDQKFKYDRLSAGATEVIPIAGADTSSP